MSKFCRECGTSLAQAKTVKAPALQRNLPLQSSIHNEDVLIHHPSEQSGDHDEENPQVTRWMEMAFWNKESGNIPSAIMACESALMINPDSTSALSLLGCLYEQKGDMEKAIFAFERIVQLNPNSSADSEKLAALRSGVTLRPVSAPVTSKWLPPLLDPSVQSPDSRNYTAMVFAILAAVVVFGVGISLIKGHGQNSKLGRDQIAPVGAVASTPHTPEFQYSRKSRLNSENTVNPPNRIVSAQNIIAAQPPKPAQVQSTLNSIAVDPNLLGGHLSPNYRPTPISENGVPPLGVAASANSDAPYSVSVKPITVPATQLSPSAVQLASNAEIPQHKVIVGDNNQTQPANLSTQDSPDLGGPVAPDSHIFIKVHDTSPSESPSDNSHEATSEQTTSSTNATSGASLQAKALSAQQKGEYASAKRLYNAAIDAYKADFASGQSAEEAQRGINSCQTGIEICKQSE